MTVRRFPVGAEPQDGGVHFRVWAPSRRSASVVIEGEDHPLEREASGHFSGLVAGAGEATSYRFRLDGEAESYPDPASRWQPDGPHGASVVVDPRSHAWRDGSWRAPALRDLVISEIHIGTFAPEGTWRAAIDKLPLLADAGINAVEVMPVSEYPGAFGWGYDGVAIWAPSRLYGTPDDFRGFVGAAHAAGIAVLLDVVYNHLGPDGCYLTKYTPAYFTERYRNEWGDAVNFDGEQAEGVREFFASNAAYWISEFRLDGLRLDATQSIFDSSRPHVIAEIAARAREAAGTRPIVLIAENEPQDVAMLVEHGIDALWNDDWHHSMTVALTGHAEAYYSDYHGRPQELVSMAKRGFLYQGQRYRWQKNRRGTPSGRIEQSRLVCYLENHDQVANSARGARLRQQTSPGRWRAATALLLLAPQTPMLFQGEEFGSTAPFLYFADHKPELATAVKRGRREFLAQFPSVATLLPTLAVPHERATFEACKIDWSEHGRNEEVLALHRDLVRLRHGGEAFRAADGEEVDGAVLGADAFVLRRFTGDGGDRILIVNLGRDLHLDPAPEPLLAPPAGCEWQLIWSSESPEYGGSGTPELDTEENWRIPGEAAVLLKSVPAK